MAHIVLGEGGIAPIGGISVGRIWDWPILASKWRGCSRGRSSLTVFSLLCCCLFSTTVFSKHKETIERWADTSGYATITVSAMLRLALVWCVSNPVEHNGPRVTMKMTIFLERCQLFHLYTAVWISVSGRQSKLSFSKCTWREQSSYLSPYLIQSVVICVMKDIVGPLFQDVKQNLFSM